MRHENHVSDSVPRLDALSRDKNRVRQADGLANFNPISSRRKNLQLFDKISAGVWQPVRRHGLCNKPVKTRGKNV